MKKQAVKRTGTKVTLDLLAVKGELEAGTLSQEDRDTIERMLPGIIEGLSAAVKPAEVKPPPLPEAKP
jgi:hypothetical protein